MYFLKIVLLFELKDFEVFINGKFVFREIYVFVYEDVFVVIEYFGK